jgi:hypothetical protein
MSSKDGTGYLVLPNPHDLKVSLTADVGPEQVTAEINKLKAKSFLAPITEAVSSFKPSVGEKRHPLFFTDHQAEENYNVKRVDKFHLVETWGPPQTPTRYRRAIEYSPTGTDIIVSVSDRYPFGDPAQNAIVRSTAILTSGGITLETEIPSDFYEHPVIPFKVWDNELLGPDLETVVEEIKSKGPYKSSNSIHRSELVRISDVPFGTKTRSLTTFQDLLFDDNDKMVKVSRGYDDSGQTEKKKKAKKEEKLAIPSHVDFRFGILDDEKRAAFLNQVNEVAWPFEDSAGNVRHELIFGPQEQTEGHFCMYVNDTKIVERFGTPNVPDRYERIIEFDSSTTSRPVVRATLYDLFPLNDKQYPGSVEIVATIEGSGLHLETSMGVDTARNITLTKGHNNLFLARTPLAEMVECIDNNGPYQDTSRISSAELIGIESARSGTVDTFSTTFAGTNLRNEKVKIVSRELNEPQVKIK